jgi:phenylpropionate dioxygenase-like ring-hydroxylating dioxygenase large terminal subunit
MTPTAETFPNNCWYMAAHSAEVDRSLLDRELLGRPVVLYRQDSGQVVALDDRCAHRGMPLSAGHLEGDDVVCGYHGFRFSPNGTCVGVPSQGPVPYGACVRSYQVREESPVVWIWMGDPTKSQERMPPSLPWLHGDEWAFSGHQTHVEAGYMSLHENGLDLTHFPYVHPDLSPPMLDTVPPPVQLQVSELSVSYSRTFAPAPPPAWLVVGTSLDSGQTYVQREVGTFVSPALLLKFFDLEEPTPVGDARGESHTSPLHRTVYIRGFTPATASTTHVFSWIARNYELGDSTVTEQLRSMDAQLLEQDRHIVERLQLHTDRYGRVEPAALANSDLAAIKAAEIVQDMLAREQR